MSINDEQCSSGDSYFKDYQETVSEDNAIANHAKYCVGTNQHARTKLKSRKTEFKDVKNKSNVHLDGPESNTDRMELLIDCPPASSVIDEASYYKWMSISSCLFMDKHFHQHYRSTKHFYKYCILRELGRGSFGVVFSICKQSDVRKKFAMKVIPKCKLIGHSMLSRLVVNERMCLESIDHPLIASLVERKVDASNLYLIMSFAECGNLAQMKNAMNDSFTPNMTKFCAAQICLALEYLHSMDVVHRDLKPENIMLDQCGFIKLIDFGVSKLVYRGMGGDIKVTCGTYDYMAPEILLLSDLSLAKSPPGYKFSVDLWAFGVILYELTHAAGEVPFKDLDSATTFDEEKFTIKTFPAELLKVKDIFQELCKYKVEERLGCGAEGVWAVKQHTYFKDVSFIDIFRKTVASPFSNEILQKQANKYNGAPVNEKVFNAVFMDNPNKNKEVDDALNQF